MKLTASRLLAPKHGVAFLLEEGESVRIEDVEGMQVADLVVFSRADPTERLSTGNTRKLNGTLRISNGHVLYSTKCRPLLEIHDDTVGRHDLTSSACSPYDYPLRFGVTGHASCLATLAAVLEGYGIPEHLVPDPFNVFMKTSIDADGSLRVEEPDSRAGDSITLAALTDCLVAVSCCPQDQNACNGGRLTPLRLMPGSRY